MAVGLEPYLDTRTPPPRGQPAGAQCGRVDLPYPGTVSWPCLCQLSRRAQHFLCLWPCHLLQSRSLAAQELIGSVHVTRLPDPA